MLNIIAPEASALIGGCRALQWLAVPAAMGMPLRSLAAQAWSARSAGAGRYPAPRSATRRYRHAARRSRQTSHEGHPAIVSAHGRITAAPGAR
ncbi:hypothetical protein xavtCFBP7764_08760 [Xanthomonas citri]|nr:hypothetical protein xavtCFBP7764_08760 [Xanthomonas citri]